MEMLKVSHSHPATSNELRKARVEVPLSSQPPTFEVLESLERDLVWEPTQWQCGAEFSVVRGSGFTPWADGVRNSEFEDESNIDAVGEASHPGPVDTQLGSSKGKSHFCGIHGASRSARAQTSWRGHGRTIRFNLVGDTTVEFDVRRCPSGPTNRVEEEEPPTMPAFGGQLTVVHQVEMVAMNGDDTDTFVSESSTRAVTRTQHESEHEEEQF